MLLKRSGFDFHFLKDQDQGDFLLSSSHSGFEIVGHAIDNILYINEPTSSPEVLAVSTRSISKRNRIPFNELDNSRSFHSQPIKRLRASPATIEPEPALHNSPATCDPKNLWHLRLGHASATRLSKIKSIKSTFDTTDCIACIRAKQHKLPFHESTSKSTEKGELIHSDLADPFTTSKGKAKYVITFLDDFTHYCWIKTIPDKSSITISKAFRAWIKEFENMKNYAVAL
jgi:hypothetical protein